MAEDTASKLLDAAEALFSERGISAVSVRDITTRAGTNVASAHYHFGSKDGLIKAVVKRRISAVNTRRLEMLKELKKQLGDKPVPVRDLMRAFLLPAITLIHEADGGGEHFVRFVARAQAETNETVRREMFSRLKKTVSIFLDEFERTLPNISREQVFIMLVFSAGAMMQSVLFPFDKFALATGCNSKLSRQEVIELLISFSTAGLEGGGL
ncbi:MAG: TetR/AcrR family transcriptional regulator [Candidatus Dadabacteria bacterium]|nr:MAG: TetR/AcrR family transcriptional regulator [Candidatus Dadabacteria bacterium]